ncbi:MAG TPA: 16S rRNA (cytidine(1402)-2'-O)-methyltransferase [Candidatus Saccharimonadales bacterium]|nr:16S rRNA (cytidine(1402)-2'-O)-methyltransferase [Candidatus Saccharimonadales bacterium]
MLYIVATPIGNLKDITLRALEILREVDLILCEDTRHSGQLLHQYEIKKPLLSFHEYNEIEKIPEIITRLKNGEEIALISDAGTPLVSDPGFKLVRAAREEGVEVKAIPGASAAVAALSISGLPSDKFFFVGYLPKTSGKRESLLKKLANQQKELPASLIFYESPFRVNKLLGELSKFFPNASVSVTRELTKVHEEVLTGEVSEVKELLANKSPKGEFTIIIH